jgi:ferric-dicitrate binding protein FerR (iron transport regulator)
MTDDERDTEPRELAAPDEPLDRELLEAFAVPDPSPDLGDRFSVALAAGAPAPAPVATAQDRSRIWGGIASIAAIAAVVAVLAWPPYGGESGARSATVRTTAALAHRGVAVLEAGGRIAWEIDAMGGARVHQDEGDVFYRVEPGGAFVVVTPAGEVSVHGTCFRVELAAGATIVTVYEGLVQLANSHGRIQLAAGERATSTADTAPHAPAPIAAADSPSDLVARDRAQRERIAALEAQLAARPAPSVEAIGPAHEMKHPFDVSPAELADYAKQCKVLVDAPPIAGSTLMDQITDDGMRKAQLTADERAAVRRVIASFHAGYQTQLQALYHELTGETRPSIR